jgi:CRP-like cAMP-binding protein
LIYLSAARICPKTNKYRAKRHAGCTRELMSNHGQPNGQRSVMNTAQDGMRLFLRRLMLRSVLSDEEQDRILALPGREIRVQANRDFVRMGEFVSHACLVLDGLVGRFAQTASGERQIVALHLPGDMADLHSVVSPHSNMPLQALTNSTILQIPHTALIALADGYPAVGRAFWRDGIVDNSVVSQSLLSLGRRKAASRLAHLYCELALRSETLGASAEDGYVFEATQYHIADMLGLTPVHVNRTLRSLREAGLVETGGGRVRILDWARLAQLAEFDPSYLQLEPVDLHSESYAQS